ncbi:MAG: hypothetical protein SVU88_03455 [Candidatus Nanohaloarchaea archaeon]|nr:hypothetical protein [Candidatus Nanohaloarchaea archaeon]
MGECPLCENEYFELEVCSEGRDVGPIPEKAEDFCIHLVIAPVPGVIIYWHEQEVAE